MQNDTEIPQLTKEQTEELESLLQAFGPSWKRSEQGDEEDNQNYVLGYN
ncbi:MAG: hypothetical protein O7E57_13465 [Gammaproteobacteria bacterium]|nr:hypothetical protein [Gammaproteobacteria bacterium]